MTTITHSDTPKVIYKNLDLTEKVKMDTKTKRQNNTQKEIDDVINCLSARIENPYLRLRKKR
jgi:hypothetical protein